MPSASQANRILLGLLFLALLVRLAAIPIGLQLAERRGILFYDEYGEIAKNIVEGNGFSYAWGGPLRPTSIHSPVYPGLLAGMFKVFGVDRAAPAVIVLNILIAVCLVGLAQAFLRRNFGVGPCLTGTLILGFLPTQVYYSASGLPTALYATLFFLVIVQAWRTWQEPSTNRGALWGVLIGVCALSYSFVVVLAPLLVLWLIASVPSPLRFKALVAAATAGLVAILICVPWTIRNHNVHGRWILIRDQTGINLWWGNHPNATGGARDLRGNELGVIPPEARAMIDSIHNEVDADRYMGRLAVEEMRADPKRTLVLWGRKIGMFWWFAPGPRAGGLGVGRLMPAVMFSKALMLLFFGWGMALLVPRQRALFFLLLTVCLAITCVHMIFHAGNIRYFFPLEPILALPAALATAELLGRKSKWFARMTGTAGA